MLALYNSNGSLERTAATFSVSVRTLRDYLKLLRLMPIVQAAVDLSVVSMTEALKLVDLKPEEQNRYVLDIDAKGRGDLVQRIMARGDKTP